MRNRVIVLFQLLCCFGLIGLTQGCMALNFGQSSYPSVEENATTKLNRQGVLDLPGLTLSVRPRNARVEFAMLGPIVPVIPWPGVKTRSGKEFRIYLLMEPAEEGVFSLDPAEVKIHIDGQEIAPVKFVDLPGWSLGFEYADFFGSPSDVSPGHHWICRDSELDAGTMSVVPLRGEVFFDTKVCLVLEYPMITPSPGQEFTVIIKGLRRGDPPEDPPIEVPSIHFQRKIRIRYEILSGPG